MVQLYKRYIEPCETPSTQVANQIAPSRQPPEHDMGV